MTIGIGTWFQEFLFGPRDSTSLELHCVDLRPNVAYKTLAVNACINMIAHTLSLAEFQTFEEGKETRKDLYYLLNVEPNQNQSASTFWRQVIEDLVYSDRALIAVVNDRYYRVRDWDLKEYAMRENEYSNVDVGTFERPYILKETLSESQVLSFRWHNLKLRGVMDQIYSDYDKLISSSQSNYLKGASNKAIIEIGADYPKTEAAQEDLNKLVGTYFKDFYEAEGAAILPLTRGLTYQEVSGSSSGDTSSNLSREGRNFVDDVFDWVAMAFGIPSALLRGDIANLDETVDRYMTFCINPIAEILTDELNRKLYGKANFTKRTYCKLDTTRIRAVSIKDVASSLDILTRIGAHTIDDNLRTLGREPIGGEVGGQRFMTKNYAPVEDVIAYEQKGEMPNDEE